MIEGKLTVTKNQTLQVSYTNAKGIQRSAKIQESDLSLPLLEMKNKAITTLNGLEVELEEVSGQAKKIREKGKEWETKTITPPLTKPTPTIQAQPINNNIRGDFHNPYNFIPALPRNTEDEDLKDSTPAGHGSYRHDYWSGRITVTLTTVTPLLIPDAANATEDNNAHKTYPIRKGVDGKPYLEPTSIKGMLRAAYEAITNSRLAIFEGHSDRLAYRMAAKVTVVPARVELKGKQLYLRVMDESSLVGSAAKLKRYDTRSSDRDRGENRVAIRYEINNTLPQHGDCVWVKLGGGGKVTQIRQWNNPPQSQKDWKRGWVCVTGANISGKKNERVFIENDDNDLIRVTDTIKSLWDELIRNYQQIHEKELEKRHRDGTLPHDYLGKEPGKTAWSRHVWDAAQAQLKEGTLCYVEFTGAEITSLQPVTISRRLYSIPPEKLLDSSLKPATSINELSPADRVFGWVKQKGQGSYKGNVRIYQVTCRSDDAITDFGDRGIPLAILGQPKPQQARFYQAKDKQGTQLNNGIDKAKAYSDDNLGLRGRKVYPHHQRFTEEYKRPGEERDDQNRSIKAWVNPEIKFTFTMDIINLSKFELGALLWLLTLPSNYYHRLGGGKPLGFGSVRLSINWENTDLRTGEDWKKFYSSLVPITPPDPKQAESCIEKFKQTISKAYGKGRNFEQVPFIAAFCRAAEGFNDNLPIHYPRTQAQPNPNGEGFDWFTENERSGRDGGLKLSLPSLLNDYGLPFNPT